METIVSHGGLLQIDALSPTSSISIYAPGIPLSFAYSFQTSLTISQGISKVKARKNSAIISIMKSLFNENDRNLSKLVMREMKRAVEH